MKKYTFKEHYEKYSVGIISGILAGLFFALYSDLKPQFTNTFFLLGSCLVVTLFYCIIFLFISYLFIKLKRK